MKPDYAFMPAREATLVAVDFESTGSVPGYPDEPWQIGLVPVRNGAPVMDDAYESYIRVDAERPFSPLAPGSWRKVRAELAVAPSMDELLPVLTPRMIGVPLVAHNTPTEQKILRAAWPLHRPGPWIDTLKLARVAYPKLGKHALGAVIGELGLAARVDSALPGREPHDALYDAAACAVLLVHLLEQPGWESLTVDDLVNAAPRA